MTISATTVVRLTRDAEVEIDDDSEVAIRELVEEQVRLRRYEPVVRLEFGQDADPAIREMLANVLPVCRRTSTTCPRRWTTQRFSRSRSCRFQNCATRPGHLFAIRLCARMGCSVFAAIQAGDILLHHPYDSFESSVEHFISTAADDPHTVSIKMTAYRIGDDTPFVRSLIRAAEHGKQVACVMEIKARFDEERNLHWAAELERAGAHVTFGVSGLKTHAKTALVVRKEAGGLRCYVHIGTGNYHVRTARLYVDVGLLTCDPCSRAMSSIFSTISPATPMLRIVPRSWLRPPPCGRACSS